MLALFCLLFLPSYRSSIFHLFVHFNIVLIHLLLGYVFFISAKLFHHFRPFLLHFWHIFLELCVFSFILAFISRICLVIFLHFWLVYLIFYIVFFSPSAFFLKILPLFILFCIICPFLPRYIFLIYAFFFTSA